MPADQSVHVVGDAEELQRLGTDAAVAEAEVPNVLVHIACHGVSSPVGPPDIHGLPDYYTPANDLKR